MTLSVHAWWQILCVAAVFNCVAWSVSAATLTHHRSRYSASEYRYRRWLMWLSAGYAAGCAFRSFLPRIDLERICLMQSWLSRMSVGRSVATIAELCFMAQCALLLYITGRGLSNKLTMRVSQWLLPLIVIAECASWYAILSTNYLGHVVENSLWTVCATLLLLSFCFLWPHSSRRQRHFLTAMMLFAVSYILFMVNIDVPMYWSRWQTQLAAATQYLSLQQGWLDASSSCVVSFSLSIWREEIPWMTLYFTVAVWVSILLPHAPSWRPALHSELPTQSN
ncbi:MAG: hypothetical protein QM808_05415 [Steroidobacteraceae bacterium]